MPHEAGQAVSCEDGLKDGLRAGPAEGGREGYLQPVIHKSFLEPAPQSTLKGSGSNSDKATSLRQLQWVVPSLASQPWEP